MCFCIYPNLWLVATIIFFGLVGEGEGGCINLTLNPSLTKAVDMEHIWSKYGNGMGQHMANLWALHGFYMGC